ncbi:MAG: leucine-rich repeat domain-containing protein, partial [Candidatus Kariarchaeaceae archaeon]
LLDLPFLEQLSTLDLRDNHLKVVPQLSQFPSLTTLYLSGNPIKEIIPIEHDSLEVIYLPNHFYPPEVLTALREGCKSLRILEVG